MQADGWITQVIDGVTSHTFDATVTTTEEAVAAGYTNVEQVSASLAVSASDGSYTYNLNADGSVTDGDGDAVQYTTWNSGNNTESLTTAGGTKTVGTHSSNTSMIAHGPFIRASGAIESNEFSSPVFLLAGLFRSILLGSATTTTTTVASEVGTNAVYQSVENGTVQYVGITNNVARRAAEHLASKGINIQPLMQGLTRADAKAVEQALIETHGLQKAGGTLLNKINSIAVTNPVYAQQIQRGYELLKTIGY